MKKKGILLLAVFFVIAMTFSTVATFAEDITYEKETYSYEYDFSENADSISGADLMEIFYYEGLAGGEGYISADSTLVVDGYSQLYVREEVAKTDFTGAYTYTFDFKSTANPDAAIFIRGINPFTYTCANPKNNTDSQVFNYYEWDWYTENGGKSGASASGGSGIKIFEQSSAIGITIKTYVEDGLKIVGKTTTLDLPEGYKAGQLNKYMIDDNGQGMIKITINEVALCTIEYSGEPVAYPDGNDGSCPQLYYPSAVVKDAAGNEILSVSNPRINAEYGMLAFGIRGTDRIVEIDNLKLEYHEFIPVTKPTQDPGTTPQTPETTKGPDVTKVPDATAAPKVTQEAEQKSGGCGSSVVVAHVMLIVGAAVILKKRK